MREQPKKEQTLTIVGPSHVVVVKQQELHMCKQSMVSIGRQRLVKSYFCTISVLIHFSLFFLSK